MRLACAVTTYESSSGPIIFRDGKLKENMKIMKKLDCPKCPGYSSSGHSRLSNALTRRTSH